MKRKQNESARPPYYMLAISGKRHKFQFASSGYIDDAKIGRWADGYLFRGKETTDCQIIYR